MPDAARRLSIGEVADRSGMAASRIRYYETRGLLDPPERSSGKRRYPPRVLRRLAIIEAAQCVGFSLEEIHDLLGSRNGPAHERLRRLALRKLPAIDALIVRATTVQQLLKFYRYPLSAPTGPKLPGSRSPTAASTPTGDARPGRSASPYGRRSSTS